MGAGGFPTLAAHFPDRTIVTYDPRNNGERSAADDPSVPITPERPGGRRPAVIQAIGGGPVDMFASSGGAIVSLALVAKYPNDIRTLVAHEPPFASLVPDREHALAATQAIHDAYRRGGAGAGDGQVHAGRACTTGSSPRSVAAARPGPGHVRHADRGRRRPDRPDARRTTCCTLTSYEPDFEALKRAPTRIVVAVGAESNGKLAQRAATPSRSGSGARP